MASNLFPILKKFVEDEWRRLEANQITPWAFFRSGHDVSVRTFDGQQILFGGGIDFWGSAQDQFWSRYIEPFLEDMTLRSLDKARELAKDRRLNADDPLKEAAGLVTSVARKAFRRMADIDRRLRGNGYPDSVTQRDVSREFAEVERFISDHLAAELAMVRRGPLWSVEEFYQTHQALFWSAGTIIAIALGIGAIVVAK